MAIGVTLQKLWNAWNIRGLILLSLSIQIILAFAAPLRRQTSKTFTVVLIWSTYLLADWAAIYVFGIISNTVRSSSVTPSEVNQGVLALWASFLLIHMGGPDTITAYSLEDNALWLRHLTALVVKLCVFGYIFMKSFPGNDLVAPTVLVLVTGVIKYGERTRALFLASLDSLKGSVGRRKFDKLPEKFELQDNYFFERFVGMIVDIMPSYSELTESREFFIKQEASAALKLISGELNLMYEILYTKIIAAYSTWGVFSRCTFLINMVAALVLFCLSKKDKIEGVDVKITYGLLVGAFLVDVSRRRMVIKSDWAHMSSENFGTCLILLDGVYLLFDILPFFVTEIFLNCCLRIKDKSWSETIASFNLLEYCFQKHCPKKNSNGVAQCSDSIIQKVGLAEKLDKMKYVTRNEFNKDLWKFIFETIKTRPSILDDEVKAREVYESRGGLVLRENGCDELMHYVKDFEFDRELLTWHIATGICYGIGPNGNNEKREFSKILSNYMMYLLIQQPKMMSPIAGIGHSRYSDTRNQINKIVADSGAEKLVDFCTKVLEDLTKAEPAHEKDSGSKSVMLDACVLAQTLEKNSKKWEVILGVWVEMLSYTASHCRADAHARALSGGGELVSHVWLLMAHLGIGPHRPKEEE
ncbi:hypothetical protein MLD38_031027 [Melastoma candidum]|uniref:Uncharacterized protein n=1 Tax=Melastoma candidum TaxID=119954 RepID=A0ACB9MPP6_9MYRT|nr:hypothetical protein MLD38_031027 [Melastoma candidum]